MNAVKQSLAGGMHPPLNPGHLAGRYSPTYRPPERMRCMTSATVCRRLCNVMFQPSNCNNGRAAFSF